MVIDVGNDPQYKKLYRLMDTPDLAEDERVQTNPDRVSNRKQLIPILQKRFLDKTVEEWKTLCDANAIPCGPIQNLAEVYKDPQLNARNMFLTAEHSTAGEIKMIGSPIKLSRTPVSLREAPSHLGEHNEEILKNNINGDDFMDFQLSEEQKMLKNSVRNFVDNEIMPYISEWDKQGSYDPAINQILADLGLMGVCIPEKYGGSGMDYNSLAIVCEELERGDTTFRTAVSVHIGLNSMSLLQWGTEEQKQKYLVPQAKGEKLAAFGLTEPGAGSDVAAMQSTATKEGDHYILNG